MIDGSDFKRLRYGIWEFVAQFIYTDKTTLYSLYGLANEHDNERRVKVVDDPDCCGICNYKNSRC